MVHLKLVSLIVVCTALQQCWGRCPCELKMGSATSNDDPKPGVWSAFRILVPNKQGGFQRLICVDRSEQLVCVPEDGSRLLGDYNAVGGIQCTCSEIGICECETSTIHGVKNADKFVIKIPEDEIGAHDWICMVKKPRTGVASKGSQ